MSEPTVAFGSGPQQSGAYGPPPGQQWTPGAGPASAQPHPGQGYPPPRPGPQAAGQWPPGQQASGQFPGGQYPGAHSPGQFSASPSPIPGAPYPTPDTRPWGAVQPPQPPRRGRGIAWAVGAAAVVLALVLLALHPWSRQRSAVTPAATPTPSAAPATSASAAPSDTPSASASDSSTSTTIGPIGTTTTILQHLRTMGFSCSDEQLSGYTSQYCTHYKTDPVMAAYVGGGADGTPGRVSLYNLTGDTDDTVTRLRTWLVQQVVDRQSDVATIEAAAAKAKGDGYVKASAGSLAAQVSGEGDAILRRDDWTPDYGETPIELAASTTNLLASLRKQGYTCSGTRTWTCALTDAATGARLKLMGYSDDQEPSWLEVHTTGSSRAKLLAAYEAHAPKLFALFLQGKQMQDFSKQWITSRDGASEYHGSLLYEAWSGDTGAYFHVGQSCWTDIDGWC